MQVIRHKGRLREVIAHLRQAGKGTTSKIALVPTMGALHAGHMALVKAARREADNVVVSIFVNPAQFGPHEDFAAYPRDEARDLELLAANEVDVAYLPELPEIYSEGFATRVVVAGLSEELDGVFRPQFFPGVATVVLKLLLHAMPDIALFGEKDYQQLQVIRRMVADLDIPVIITGVPTERNAEGLALSSRNAYLSNTEKAIAPELYSILFHVKQLILNGEPVAPVIERAKRDLVAKGFGPVQYLELRNAETLMPITKYRPPARLLAAAYLGKTRLIDNIAI